MRPRKQGIEVKEEIKEKICVGEMELRRRRDMRIQEEIKRVLESW